jgi:hypothetical protein
VKINGFEMADVDYSILGRRAAFPRRKFLRMQRRGEARALVA